VGLQEKISYSYRKVISSCQLSCGFITARLQFSPTGELCCLRSSTHPCRILEGDWMQEKYPGTGLEGLRVRLLPDRERERAEAVARVVKAFRTKLTPNRTHDGQTTSITKAFLRIDDDPAFLDGRDAKQRMLEASSKDLSQQEDFFKAMGESAKLCSALYSHAVKFWDVILKYES